MLEIRDKGFGVKASGGKLRFKSASNSDKTKTSKTEKGVVSPFKKDMTGDRKTVKGGQRGRDNNESYPSKKRNEIDEREKSQRKLTFKPSAMLSPVPAAFLYSGPSVLSPDSRAAPGQQKTRRCPQSNPVTPR